MSKKKMKLVRNAKVVHFPYAKNEVIAMLQDGIAKAKSQGWTDAIMIGLDRNGQLMMGNTLMTEIELIGLLEYAKENRHPV